MYKVIIVEDEENILKSIQYMINWSELDCVVVGTAWSGELGLDLICDLRPDIVISDVRMPFMDGLEMIKKGLECHNFESIIISGYSSFEYAKTAIHLGVNEYVLKPIDYDEVESSIERIVSKIVGMKSVKKNENINHYSKRVKGVMEYIEENINSKITLSELCEVFNISSTTLNNLFKKELNTTVNAYINRRKIKKSIELIQSEKYLVYEIAEILGFSDYKYFSRVFKKYTSQSPTEFMKNK